MLVERSGVPTNFGCHKQWRTIQILKRLQITRYENSWNNTGGRLKFHNTGSAFKFQVRVVVTHIMYVCNK